MNVLPLLPYLDQNVLNVLRREFFAPLQLLLQLGELPRKFGLHKHLVLHPLCEGLLPQKLRIVCGLPLGFFRLGRLLVPGIEQLLHCFEVKVVSEEPAAKLF